MEQVLSASVRCAVIGHGSWATAIVKMLCLNEARVGWMVANPLVRDSLTSHGRNPKYLRDVEFDTSKIDVTADINVAVGNADVVILAVPSAFLADVLEPLTEPLSGKFVVSAIKGIIPGEYRTVSEYVNSHFDVPYDNIGVITGPTHAEEVAAERLSYLTVACKSERNAQLLADKFRTPYMHTRTSTDIYGLEYGGVLKNIYAMMAGVASGAGYGDNFIAVIVANAAAEMSRFVNTTYPFERNVDASPFLGDLLVTSYSQYGRNRAFGMMIGRGYSVLSARFELKMIAEGYYGSECIHNINARAGVDMPIADALYEILYEGSSPRRVLRELSNKLI